jgi:Carboxypeptidase regulatory-like domain
VAENRSVFLRPLKNKGFKEDRVAKVGANGLDNSTTLESNKSLQELSEGQAEISLLTAASTSLFNALLTAELNIDFPTALADLFADGDLELAGTETVAEEVEMSVAEEEQRRGVMIEVASTIGSIRGTVIDTVGRPLPGAQVVAMQNGTEVGMANTTADGSFLLENIPEGTILVTASLEGFLMSIPETVVVVAAVTIDVPPLY